MVTAIKPKRLTAPQLAELVRERDQLRERLEVSNARGDALRLALARVLALDDPKQHRFADEQAVLRDAQALVAELQAVARQERG